MKIQYFFTVLSGISAKKEERGKPGRADFSQIREDKHNPICLLDPSKPRCEKMRDSCTFNIKIARPDKMKGVIEVGSEATVNYGNMQSCKWEIELPSDYEILLQFESMNLEWHRNCYYDKVHILDGSGGRLGRWCGPRYHYPEGMPWDGERRFRNKCRNFKDPEKRTCEDLEMYDTPFDTLSNKIIIFFDTDESFIPENGGFKLKWSAKQKWAVANGQADNYLPKSALHFVHDSIENALIRGHAKKGHQVSGLKRWNDNIYAWATKNMMADFTKQHRGCRRKAPTELIKNKTIIEHINELKTNIDAINMGEAWPGKRVFWGMFQMHKAANLYTRIMKEYYHSNCNQFTVPHTFIHAVTGLEKSIDWPFAIRMADSYADIFNLNTIPGKTHWLHYDENDRNLANDTPQSNLDLSELL